MALCALLIAFSAPASAAAESYPPHMLKKIHKMRNRTWHYQDLMGHARTPYYYWAENRCGNLNCRYQVLQIWRHRSHIAKHRYKRWLRNTGGVPASVRAMLMCIHPLEEPSWYTVAGGLGFVYPPSSYNVGITDTLAARYGDRWPNWPVNAQLLFAYQLVKAYGYSPWTSDWSNCP
jgi:hypothetical protein